MNNGEMFCYIIIPDSAKIATFPTQSSGVLNKPSKVSLAMKLRTKIQWTGNIFTGSVLFTSSDLLNESRQTLPSSAMVDRMSFRNWSMYFCLTQLLR